MPEYIVTDPNGKKYRVTAPEGATQEQVLAYAQQNFQKPPSLGEMSRMVNDRNPLNLITEPVQHLATTMLAGPAAGYAGMFGGADAVERTAERFTYQPQGALGQAATDVVTYPFRKLAEFADETGQDVMEGAVSPRAHLASGGTLKPRSAGPAAATAVNAGLQLLPAALFMRRPARATQPDMSATGAPRAPYSNVGAGPMPQPPARGTMPRPQAPPRPNPEQVARDYVARNTSLNWASLSDSVKATLTEIASDARVLERLDPAALERQARLESLPEPIKATRGQITRDPVQLRNEGNVSATEAGKPIRESYVAQNRAILRNLEILKGRYRSTAETPEAVGLSVQDQALRAKLQVKKKEVSDLYKKAEAAGELQGNVSTRTLARLIAETPDKHHLAWVDSWLKRSDIVRGEKGAETAGLRYKASLKELEDLRQAAVARAMDGGTEGFYAGKIIRAIDEATEGAGGAAYKAARKARKEQAMEFEEQGAVARLVENKSRTDRATAVEDTWRKTVLGGSIEDLRTVKRSLLTGGDTKTRTAGRKAWRDLQAETIRHIEREATKNVQRFENGDPNVTPAAMERAIRSIGPEKLEALFGQGTVRRLNEIMEATRIVKTDPPAGHRGSSTFSNMLAFLEKGLGKIPVLGDVASGTVRAGVKLHEMGKAGREARTATTTPMEEALRAARRRNPQP